MPKFTSGTRLSYPKGKTRKDGGERKQKYLRISAGPQRGTYVHVAIMEAVLGRKLEKDETVEHLDGNGLNVGWGKDGKFNLKVVSRKMNTRLRTQRLAREKREELGARALDEGWLESPGEEAPF